MTQNTPAFPVIKCPHCGWEYRPADLFMPDDGIGRPTTVIRDALGKIIYQEYEEGREPNLSAKYICDNCDKQFVVDQIITYKASKEVEELDFSDPYVSLLND